MFENKKIITTIINDTIIVLTIYGEASAIANLIEISIEESIEYGETLIQLKEGCYYEYEISKGYKLQTSEIVSQSKVNPSSGRISPNIYVGGLSIDIIQINNNEKFGEIKLEVQSVKTTYREDYRNMLKDITEKCIDLLLQHSSPVSQYFEIDYEADAQTLYQRFAFIKSVIDSEDFNEAVLKVISAPVTKFKTSDTVKDIRAVRKINNNVLRQIACSTNRIKLSADHPLHESIRSVPDKINVQYNIETVDTPENRFIKHVLHTFILFCEKIRGSTKNVSRLSQEAILLENKLQQFLSHSIFKEVSSLKILPLNSPVLQRKAGYREVLRVWLMFDLAAKLAWKGGHDVYSGGKRNVAVLYEYWLFFKLLDIIKNVFKIKESALENLIEITTDGLGLKLKQGKFLPVKGIYISDTRNLNVQFSYNKTFSGNKEYPASGSWTRDLRPDYTLSIWPYGINEEQAEIEELIVHIHFDAKYKVENLGEILGGGDLNEEREEQKMGTYKRADLLKMHTYRDAIRRTAGAYVLYPGTEFSKKRGFHEVLPGLGAFSIGPSINNNGAAEVEIFLEEVIKHFLNRASQREKISLKTFQVYNQEDLNSEVNESLPEPYGINRNLLPDDTFILVAFYKDAKHLKWIEENQLYNARINTQRGSLRLNAQTAGAKYLLLHTSAELTTNKIFKLQDKGPRVFSKEKMLDKLYQNPSQPYYLIYDLGGNVEAELKTFYWDISKLDGYASGRGSGIPFSVSLAQLMKTKILF